MLFFENIRNKIENKIINEKILSNFNYVTNIDIFLFNDYFIIKRPIVNELPNDNDRHSFNIYFNDNSKLILSNINSTHIYYSTPEYTSSSNIINIEKRETRFPYRVAGSEGHGFMSQKVVCEILNNINIMTQEEILDCCLLKHDINIRERHEYIFFLSLMNNLKLMDKLLGF